MTLLQKIEKGGVITQLKKISSFVELEVRDDGSVRIRLSAISVHKDSRIKELEEVLFSHELKPIYEGKAPPTIIYLRLEHA